MIKAKVIKSFYYAKDKDIYLDEERFKELKEQGYVELVDSDNDEQIETAILYADDVEVAREEKVIRVQNGKKRVLPK